VAKKQSWLGVMIGRSAEEDVPETYGSWRGVNWFWQRMSGNVLYKQG